MELGNDLMNTSSMINHSAVDQPMAYTRTDMELRDLVRTPANSKRNDSMASPTSFGNIMRRSGSSSASGGSLPRRDVNCFIGPPPWPPQRPETTPWGGNAQRNSALQKGLGDTCLSIGSMGDTQRQWSLRSGADWTLPCGPSSQVSRTPTMNLGQQPGLDPSFAVQCEMQITEERDDLVDAVLSQPSVLPLARCATASLITVTRPRLRAFLAGEGAVYSQYDLRNATYMGGPLLEGWEACRSRSTGRMYYLNRTTMETQWEYPEVPLHPEWVEKSSRSTGASYYVNKRTSQNSWTRPVDEEAYWKKMLGAPQEVGENKPEGDLAIEADAESSLPALVGAPSGSPSGAAFKNQSSQLPALPAP